jgi:hypothetical protein
LFFAQRTYEVYQTTKDIRNVELKLFLKMIVNFLAACRLPHQRAPVQGTRVHSMLCSMRPTYNLEQQLQRL